MVQDYGGLVRTGTIVWAKLNRLANSLNAAYDLADIQAKVDALIEQGQDKDKRIEKLQSDLAESEDYVTELEQDIESLTDQVS